jgi:ribosome-binding factor A
MRPVSTSQARLGADIQRLLSLLLQREVADPRLMDITIARAEPAHGGQQLILWVHKPGEKEPDYCIRHLNRLAPHFSHKLRRSLSRRRLPKLVFRWDDAIDSGVMDLLHAIKRRT